jgi:phage tail protein X
MGNFEKLVVLTVLFLSAIVLAVSLNLGDDVLPASGPLEAARARLDGGRPVAPHESALPKPFHPEENRQLYLSSQVAPIRGGGQEGAELEDETTGPMVSSSDSAAPDATPRYDGKARILRDARGLDAAGIDDYRIYTLAGNDTWADLSLRFFGDAAHVENLRIANEGMDELVAGQRIMVPVYDFLAETTERAPLRPLVSAPAPRAAAPAAVVRPVAATALPTATGDLLQAKVYKVRAGDTLSAISQRVYGSAHRWKDIYDANAGLLKSPDWVQEGMQLVIPRGEAVLVPAVSTEAGAETARKRGVVR